MCDVVARGRLGHVVAQLGGARDLSEDGLVPGDGCYLSREALSDEVAEGQRGGSLSVRHGESGMQQGNMAPDWSGVFWEQEDGTGYMSVSWADTRERVDPPKGWKLTEIQEHEDALVFVYRKAS